MAALRPRVTFLLIAILVCFILVKQVHAQTKCDQSLSAESCSEESNPKTEVMGSEHDDDDDDDDNRDGHVKVTDEGGDDPDDDRPEIVVMGH
ncbi:hypothetical protein ACS0TY_030896 [Phlomoides rotata]